MKVMFRGIILVPVLCAFLMALIFMGLGLYEVILGIVGILKREVHSDRTPGLMLFEALDVFLIGFLFIVFAIGFSQLFIPKPSRFLQALESIIPKWLEVKNFTELKMILWDTVLTSLIILFIGEIFRKSGIYDWKITIIPIAVLLFSLAKYFIKKGGGNQ